MTEMKAERKAYPSDVSDEEWAFVAPYLTLMTQDAPQRGYPLREVFNAVRYVARGGISWRMLPNDLPPWTAVYQQMVRWLKAGGFAQICHDLRRLLRLREGRHEEPSAAVIDSRTLSSTPESGARAGHDGAKKRRGCKIHMAVDTLGHLLALHVSPADEQDREHVETLTEAIRQATGETVQLVWADQGYTGEDPAFDAERQGIELVVVKRPDDAKGFVLLPRRWVVEPSFGWMSRFRRLARDYERLPETLTVFHFLAFAMLLVTRFFSFCAQSA
jgi:transposase